MSRLSAELFLELTREPAGWNDLTKVYGARVRDALTGSILPFWWRTIDDVHGGVLNCWNNHGTELLSRNKFTWSQGRFLWLWSRMSEVVRRELMPGDANRYLVQAALTVKFLRQFAFIEEDRCVYLLSEEGRQLEAIPGQGLALSIYADCFVVMGLAEFARVSKDHSVWLVAWRLYESIRKRLESGGFPTHPYPIPTGHEAHAIAMIHLNVTLVMLAACEALEDPRVPEVRAATTRAVHRLLDRFALPDGPLVEFRRSDGENGDALLCRHMNPGHALEGLWMVLTVAVRQGRADWIARASQAIVWSLEKGWDPIHGGLFLYVDREGGPPRGTGGESAYETAVRTGWDAKLWWVHSEAIYASLLAYRLTGDETLRAWFELLWNYALSVFPNPDKDVGEWIQIRDRRGFPLDRVVALPVKDPYHLARNLIQMQELLSGRPLTSCRT